MIEDLSYPEFCDLLSERLAGNLPGQSAQFQMAPLSRRQPGRSSVEAKSCREAAVLALFYPCSKGRPKMLLTERPHAMNQHAGQVAFPGGRREEGESLEETALRETEEEVLIERTAVDLCGTLTPLYIPPSNFCVYPYVGFIDFRPDMTVETEEVAHMFGVRGADLINADMRAVELRTISGVEREVPHFTFNGKFVWGATAMMIAELAAVIDPELINLQSPTSEQQS